MLKLQNPDSFQKSVFICVPGKIKTPSLIFLTALIIRLIYHYLNNSVAAFYDVYFYSKLAQHFVSGDFAGGIDPFWSPLYPVLIALVALLNGSFLSAILIISFVAGSIVPVVTYYLIRQSYGEREAVIGGILAAFFPHLTNITFQLGTENIYSIFVISAVVIFWKALKENLAKYYFLTGVFLGFAYLTRPEAAGYVLFFIGIGLSKFFTERKSFSKELFKNCALLTLGFFLLSSPYIFYLRQTTGEWTISAKFKHHVLGSNFADNLDLSKENNREIQENLKTNYPLGIKQILAKSIRGNLRKVRDDAYQFFPPYLFLLVGVGFFRSAWSGERFKREIYLLLFCFVTIFGYLITVIEIRYFFVLLPILFGWTAKGITETENWVKESLKEKVNFKVLQVSSIFTLVSLILFVYIYTLPLNPFYRQPDVQWGFVEGRFEEKKAGYWLRENAKPHSVIMSSFFIAAFYAEADYVETPKTSIEDVFNEIYKKNVDYLVVSQRDISYTPRISRLLTEPKKFPALEIVYQADDQPGFKIAVYRINKELLSKERLRIGELSEH